MAWDYTTTEYQNQANADERWHLERMINFGLNGTKLEKELLRKYLAELKIPDSARDLFELLIWNKKF